MITLYWAPRTRSLRALWALEEAGADYRLETVDIHAPGRSPEHLAAHPFGKVPALRDGAAALGESAAICAYIAERFPQAGLAPAPGDPLRARYFYWLFFSPANIEPAFAEKIVGFSLPPISAGWSGFDKVIDVLEAQLKQGPWILGEDFSAADITIGSDILFGIERMKVIEPRPVFLDYLARCKARPALRRALEIDAAGGRA